MRPGPSPQCSGRCGRNAGPAAGRATRRPIRGHPLAAGRRSPVGLGDGAGLVAGSPEPGGPGQLVDRRLELRLRLLDPDHRLVEPAPPDLGEDDHEPRRVRRQQVVRLALGQRRLPELVGDPALGVDRRLVQPPERRVVRRVARRSTGSASTRRPCSPARPASSSPGSSFASACCERLQRRRVLAARGRWRRPGPRSVS